MRYCSNCGEKSQEEAKFCANCGSALQKNQLEVEDTAHINQENTDYLCTENHQPIGTGTKVLLYIITMFITLVGMIVGIIYMSDPMEEKRRFGKGLLIFSIIWTVLIFILPIVGALVFFLPLRGVQHMYF